MSINKLSDIKTALVEKKLSRLVIVSAPSGSGKSSLLKALSEARPVKNSISYTTRPKRPQEAEGKDYHFVSEVSFEQMIAEHAFLEWTKTYNFYYGTPWKAIMDVEQGEYLILEIDVKGFQKIKQSFEQISSIFILPPNVTTLRDRILKRQPDIAIDELDKRLAFATYEIEHAYLYDYLIMNDVFDDALSSLKNIFDVLPLRTSCCEDLIIESLQKP